jgi:hypothetical protein
MGDAAASSIAPATAASAIAPATGPSPIAPATAASPIRVNVDADKAEEMAIKEAALKKATAPPEPGVMDNLVEMSSRVFGGGKAVPKLVESTTPAVAAPVPASTAAAPTASTAAVVATTADPPSQADPPSTGGGFMEGLAEISHRVFGAPADSLLQTTMEHVPEEDPEAAREAAAAKLQAVTRGRQSRAAGPPTAAPVGETPPPEVSEDTTPDEAATKAKPKGNRASSAVIGATKAVVKAPRKGLGRISAFVASSLDHAIDFFDDLTDDSGKSKPAKR